MIANTLRTPCCGRQNSRIPRPGAVRKTGESPRGGPTLRSGPTGGLLEENPSAPDLLGAERAEERGHDPVHQLEVGGQRRDALLRVVEDLLVERLRVEDRARAAVDEDEARLQDE